MLFSSTLHWKSNHDCNVTVFQIEFTVIVKKKIELLSRLRVTFVMRNLKKFAVHLCMKYAIVTDPGYKGLIYTKRLKL